MKNKFFILGLILLILLSVSVVSASENDTLLNQTNDCDSLQLDNFDMLSDEWDVDDEEEEYDGDPIPAKIIVKDYNSYYDSNKKLSVQVKDLNGNLLDDVCVKVKFYSNNVNYDCTDSKGKVSFYVNENAGKHSAFVSLDDSHYTAKKVKITVKITKAPVKVSVKKIYTDTASYFTMKATVKDRWGDEVFQGNVKFTVNGKTYTSKVRNGVATKKIKLTNPGTYTYKAEFSSKNYKSKVAYSKVHVKKVYPVKKGKYRFKLSEKQYKIIQYVKSHKHNRYLSTYADFKIKTDKTYNGLPVYAIITTWSGIRNGNYLHYPQVQFVVMYSKNTWDYLTLHYTL